MNPEVNTDTDERTSAKIASGKWGFMFHYYTFQDELAATGVKFDWDARTMPTPKVDGKSYVIVTQLFDGNPYWGMVTGAKTKYPELVASLLDYNLSKEASDVLNWGILGQTYKVNADGSKEYLPVVTLPTNPAGTKTPKELGIQRNQLMMFRVADLNGLKYNLSGTRSFRSDKELKDMIKKGDVTPVYTAPLPQLTSQEQERVSTIMTPIETFVNESQVKFVFGDRSFAEWDDFVASIRKMGDIDWVINLYNSKPKPKLAQR